MKELLIGLFLFIVILLVLLYLSVVKIAILHNRIIAYEQDIFKDMKKRLDVVEEEIIELKKY